MTLGEKIRFLRTKQKLSQETLAKALNTTKQAIYKYENGIVTNIPLDKVEILSNVLNTTPSYLMGWEDNTPAEQELSEGEKALLDLFRRVPEDQRQLVLQMIRAAINTKG